MRALNLTGLGLVSLMLTGVAALAEDVPALPVPTAVLVAAPISNPQAIVAAQAAETLGAVAAMRARLGQLVPTPPRSDAIAQSAADFSAHWRSVIAQYSDLQDQMIEGVILGLNTQHQTRINDFLTAEPMVPDVSLFADSQFTIPTEFPTDFTNPPLLDAGFFGS